MFLASRWFLFFFITLGTLPRYTQCTMIQDTFSIGDDDTVSLLYQWAKKQVEDPDNRGISIVFDHNIIIELKDDSRSLNDIGMNSASNDILIIQKPDFVALLEMVHDIKNIGNIPGYKQAKECLSGSSAKQSEWQSVLEYGEG